MTASSSGPRVNLFNISLSLELIDQINLAETQTILDLVSQDLYLNGLSLG